MMFEHDAHIPTDQPEWDLRSAPSSDVELDLKSLPVFFNEGEPSQVLVPYEGLKRLLDERYASRLVRKFRDPNTRWMSVEEVGLRLAGSRIAEARKAKSLTQKQLAAKLKVPQSMISRIEKNPDRSTLKTLKKIAAALGVDIKALI